LCASNININWKKYISEYVNFNTIYNFNEITATIKFDEIIIYNKFVNLYVISLSQKHKFNEQINVFVAINYSGYIYI